MLVLEPGHEPGHMSPEPGHKSSGHESLGSESKLCTFRSRVRSHVTSLRVTSQVTSHQSSGHESGHESRVFRSRVRLQVTNLRVTSQEILKVNMLRSSAIRMWLKICLAISMLHTSIGQVCTTASVNITHGKLNTTAAKSSIGETAIVLCDKGYFISFDLLTVTCEVNGTWSNEGILECYKADYLGCKQSTEFIGNLEVEDSFFLGQLYETHEEKLQNQTTPLWCLQRCIGKDIPYLIMAEINCYCLSQTQYNTLVTNTTEDNCQNPCPAVADDAVAEPNFCGTNDAQLNHSKDAYVAYAKAARCEEVPELMNGNYSSNVSEPYYAHDELKIVCNPEYALRSDSNILYCNRNGTWNLNGRTCELLCSETPPIENGDVSFNNVSILFPGAKLGVTCETGYQANLENAELECQANGTWNGPSCIKTCSELPTIINGNAITDNATLVEGDTVLVTCSEGYAASLPIQSIVCQSDGTWNITNLGTCDKTCDSVPIIVNGHVSVLNETYTAGRTLSLICDQGYMSPQSDPIITCLENGVWDANNHTCDKACDSNPIVPYGTVTYNESKLYLGGDTLAVTCPDGFEGNNKSVVVICQANGNWSMGTECCKVTPESFDAMKELTKAMAKWFQDIGFDFIV